MKLIIPLLAVAFYPLATLQAQDPSPDRILEGARMSAALTKLDDGLKGHLSHKGKKIPITIYLKGENIQFQFLENKKWRIFHLRLEQNSYDLFEKVGEKWIDFPSGKLTDPIAGTDLTYEDLALRFFYWPSPKLEGKEKVGTESTYKLRLNKPSHAAGNYYAVYVWVHQKFGAFMKINGHGKNGDLMKEFEVEDVMKVDKDVWTLRKMQVATYKGGRRTSITDMILEKPSTKALKGLH
ncbi:MAG: outer membrane lipoprotein-sorting protein [Akkermansiaceae bacterium]